MSQYYSDPERENDTHTLPDVEVWRDYITIIRSKCGEFKVGRDSHHARGFCPSCDRATCVRDLDDGGIEHTERTGWFWWSCFPGCLPDSDPYGPFDSEQDALDDAREY